jgi:hypothetical protein
LDTLGPVASRVHSLESMFRATGSSELDILVTIRTYRSGLHR